MSAAAPTTRRLGRFVLHSLLGKSSRSMLWHASDPARGQDWVLHLPRQQPADAAALEAWLREARHAARLSHPHLVPSVEIGVESNWPFVACERAAGRTLAEVLGDAEPPAPTESAQWLVDALEGLAYLHEAGVAHHDLALHTLVLTPQGRVALMAPGVGRPATLPALGVSAGDTADLQHARGLHESDLMAAGALLQRLLGGSMPLDDADVPGIVDRVRRGEIARLPWTTPHLIPEALRAIANRALEREPQRRYLGARSLVRALAGWLEAQSADAGGPLALLLDRLQTVGPLPARPGLSGRVAQLVSMEQGRLDELVDVIVQDPALALELLRTLNAVRYAAHTGDGPVTTVRRAVQLIGLAGVRSTSQGLRAWPGPLSSAAADALAHAMDIARTAGHIAEVVCPPDLDAEEALLIALLQHLGSLLVRYHFPDEAVQIAQLVHPVAAAGQPAPRPMEPEAAANAVIGTDLDSLAVAVAQHWGLDEEMLRAMRPLPTDTPVRQPDDRVDRLRAVASCASEVAAGVPIPKVVTRYVRALGVTTDELGNAQKRARRLISSAAPATARAA